MHIICQHVIYQLKIHLLFIFFTCNGAKCFHHSMYTLSLLDRPKNMFLLWHMYWQYLLSGCGHCLVFICGGVHSLPYIFNTSQFPGQRRRRKNITWDVSFLKSLNDYKWSFSEEEYFFEVAEAVFVGWFSFEYVIRFVAAPQKTQ